ncbi:MAG: anion permease [Desulfurococcaceae archaeon]
MDMNRSRLLKALIPLVIGLSISIIPTPQGLTQSAWLYFALFVAVIAGVILEPIPAAAIGLIGITVAAISGLVYTAPGDAIKWCLSGFADTTVWLIFAAFIFALGYAKTGLGRRIALLFIKYLGRRSLGLGYAIALSDLVLAPFMPSNTARSGGTIYPIISNIPPIYGSKPGDGTERRIGSFIMWTAFTATCITSSMFLTSLAPNVLAVSLAAKEKIAMDWLTWFIGFLPVGVTLFIATPILAYMLYPPEIRRSEEAPKWASEELRKIGRITKREIAFLCEVVLALILWIVAKDYVNATTVALFAVSLMLITSVTSWDDVLTYKSAWNVFVWFATLVTMADGLYRVGFVKYVADMIASTIKGLDPFIALMIVVSLFYWLHYLFASLTAHVTALYPIFLTTALGIPGISPQIAAYSLAYTLGLMGVISPYATGPAPVYYGSGYIKSRDFWKLGLVFGLIFYATYIAIGLPWLMFILK